MAVLAGAAWRRRIGGVGALQYLACRSGGRTWRAWGIPARSHFRKGYPTDWTNYLAFSFRFSSGGLSGSLPCCQRSVQCPPQRHHCRLEVSTHPATVGQPIFAAATWFALPRTYYSRRRYHHRAFAPFPGADASKGMASEERLRPRQVASASHHSGHRMAALFSVAIPRRPRLRIFGVQGEASSPPSGSCNCKPQPAGTIAVEMPRSTPLLQFKLIVTNFLPCGRPEQGGPAGSRPANSHPALGYAAKCY